MRTEVYYTSRKKKGSVFTRIIFFYIALVLLRLLLFEYGVFIVDLSDTDTMLPAEYRGAKVLMLSSPYVFSIFRANIQRKRTPQLGDIVLVHSHEYLSMATLAKIMYHTIVILSLGIVKTHAIYEFRSVEGIPGQWVTFSSRDGVVSTSALAAEELIPFFDTAQSMRLSSDELFLQGTVAHEFDSRLLGPVPIERVKGRAMLLLHPHWKTVQQISRR